MNNIKRLSIILLVVGVVALISSSFMGSEVLGRAIIIGIGIDGDADNVKVTAEVISPGNGSEQIGTYSKIVTATGRSVVEAIKKIAEKTGKEASLGQCLLLILGEEYFTETDFTDVLTYFIKSDSFRESAVVCCCQGSAEELMNKGVALSQSVSLALVTMMLDQAEKVGIPTNNLLKFSRSQRELDKTGFLNYVRFSVSQNQDSQNPDKPQGYFLYKEAAVFKDNKFLCMLTEEETEGFALFQEDVLGESMVSKVSGEVLTLNINDKKVGGKLNGQEIEMEIKLSANLSRTDSANESGSLTYKEKSDIPPEVLDDIKKQAEMLALNFLNKQIEHNFDIINLHEIIRQKQGNSKELEELPAKEIPVKLKISIEEK